MTKKQKILIIARIVFLFISVFCIAVVVALSQLDMNSLRGSLLNVLRTSTGLPIEINGDMSWKLSLRPRVTMRGVVIPNSGNAVHKNILEAGAIDVRIDLISLFFNRPTIQHVRINDANIYLDKNKRGEYILPTVKEGKESGDVNSASGTIDVQSEYPFVEPGLGGLDIRNLKLVVGGAEYNLARLALRYMNRMQNREYKGWLNIHSTVIPFVVSFEKYNSERKIYPVKFAFSSDGDTLVANVALEGTSKMPIDFVVKGSIPDVTPIGEFLNIQLPKMPRIDVNLAGGMGYNKLTLHKSSIAVRGSEIIMSGVWDWTKKTPEINVKLASKKINLPELFPELYMGKSHNNRHAPNVFHDMPLFGDYLYDKRISATVDVGQLIVYKKLMLDNLKINASVRDANLHVGVNTGFADGTINAAIDGAIDPDGRMHLEMGGIGRDVTLGKILEQIHTNNFISGLPLNFDTYVQASGTNLSQVMQTITGPLRMTAARPGYAHSELVAYMYGEDFLTSLRHSIHDLFSSNKKYDQMTINCMSVNLKLRDGVVETHNGVAMETNAINILLDGDVNLGAETIKLALTTIPVRGIKLSITGNVVNTITITGNLAEPDIKISGAAIAGKALSATGLGLLLAPITGGIGLVAGAGVGLLAGDLLENWLADPHPCRTALKSGAPSRRGDPEWMDMAPGELAQRVINIGKNLDSNK